MSSIKYRLHAKDTRQEREKNLFKKENNFLCVSNWETCVRLELNNYNSFKINFQTDSHNFLMIPTFLFNCTILLFSQIATINYSLDGLKLSSNCLV